MDIKNTIQEKRQCKRKGKKAKELKNEGEGKKKVSRGASKVRL